MRRTSNLGQQNQNVVVMINIFELEIKPGTFFERPITIRKFDPKLGKIYDNQEKKVKAMHRDLDKYPGYANSPTDLPISVQGMYIPFFDILSFSMKTLVFYVQNNAAWIFIDGFHVKLGSSHINYKSSHFCNPFVSFQICCPKHQRRYCTKKLFLAGFLISHWYQEMDLLPLSHFLKIINDHRQLDYYAKKLSDGTFNYLEFVFSPYSIVSR